MLDFFHICAYNRSNSLCANGKRDIYEVILWRSAFCWLTTSP